MAVQILGHDKHGKTLVSNTSWVIELEGKSGNPNNKRFRRVYNNPFELIAVLQEILATGNEDELRLFLLQFDIPLDLVLPPRNFQRQNSIDSKGNIEGTLPTHRSYIFSTRIKDVYEECLKRLFLKLEHHAEVPQVNKLNNF